MKVGIALVLKDAFAPRFASIQAIWTVWIWGGGLKDVVQAYNNIKRDFFVHTIFYRI